MNEKNLIPFDQRTESEQREIRSKGGKASGVSRCRKRDMQSCSKFILSLPTNTKIDWDTLIEAGISLENITEEEATNLLVVTAALINKAKSGDVKAIKELRSIIRDDEYLKIEKERLKLEKQKLERKDDNSDVFAKLDDVLSKIGE